MGGFGWILLSRELQMRLRRNLVWGCWDCQLMYLCDLYILKLGTVLSKCYKGFLKGGRQEIKSNSVSVWSLYWLRKCTCECFHVTLWQLKWTRFLFGVKCTWCKNMHKTSLFTFFIVNTALYIKYNQLAAVTERRMMLCCVTDWVKTDIRMCSAEHTHTHTLAYTQIFTRQKKKKEH